jgi:acyl-CoA reductase-like NAD-dependent aldehyde dehydrogenase
MTYQSIKPFDGKTLRTFEELTDEALEEAVGTAATTYETWRKGKPFWRPCWMGDAIEGGPINATLARRNRHVF